MKEVILLTQKIFPKSSPFNLPSDHHAFFLNSCFKDFNISKLCSSEFSLSIMLFVSLSFFFFQQNFGKGEIPNQ